MSFPGFSASFSLREAVNNGTIDPNNVIVVRKFGRNLALGTTFAPLAIGGIYHTPQVSGATKLRVKAGDTNDSSSGSGAQSIMIEGLNEAGVLTSEILSTNGASAGADSVNDYLRLFRFYVASSGTYASTTASSHAADITIENPAGS